MKNLLKQTINLLKHMYTESSLATAQIAKIFGSELLKVQESARTDSGSQPSILSMHPKQFLGSSPQELQAKKREEALLMQALQKEAELSHPLPPPQAKQTSQPPSPSVNRSSDNINVQPSPLNQTNVGHQTTDVWEKINHNLERIANRLEQVDLSVKKKRIKRNTTNK